MRLPRLLIGLAVLSSPAAAQASLLGPGAAFISTGRASIDTKELDARLDARGYPTFGQSATSVGIGGYRILPNHVVLGAEITGLNAGKQLHLGQHVGLSGGYATLGVGYMKQISPRLRWYPRFGFGAGGLTVWIRNAVGQPFDSVLANPHPVPTRDRLLTRSGPAVDLGVGFEFLTRRDHGFLIGLRTGLLGGGGDKDGSWWTQNGTVTEGPKASIGGAYLRLVIGGAWPR